MTRDVVTVRPETPLKDVAEILVERDISGLPVVDDAGHVQGVISETDILYKEREEAPKKRGIISHLLHWGASQPDPKVDARNAGEAMTSPPVTVSRTSSIARAAGIMADAGVHRLVVVDDPARADGETPGPLVGIVSRSDFVRAFARSDERIKREIDDIVERQIWMPSEISATVDRGEVVVTGTVDLKSGAEALVWMLQQVPGVVAVDHTGLTWTREADGV